MNDAATPNLSLLTLIRVVSPSPSAFVSVIPWVDSPNLFRSGAFFLNVWCAVFRVGSWIERDWILLQLCGGCAVGCPDWQRSCTRGLWTGDLHICHALHTSCRPITGYPMRAKEPVRERGERDERERPVWDGASVTEPVQERGQWESGLQSVCSFDWMRMQCLCGEWERWWMCRLQLQQAWHRLQMHPCWNKMEQWCGQLDLIWRSLDNAIPPSYIEFIVRFTKFIYNWHNTHGMNTLRFKVC